MFYELNMKFIHRIIHTISLLSVNLNLLGLAIFKWRPFSFVSYLIRFQTIMAERNFETTYDYIHKLKQISKRPSSNMRWISSAVSTWRLFEIKADLSILRCSNVVNRINMKVENIWEYYLRIIQWTVLKWQQLIHYRFSLFISRFCVQDIIPGLKVNIGFIFCKPLEVYQINDTF